MKPELPTAIVGAGAVALLGGLAVAIGAPQAARVVLGLPLVFILPGFVAVGALLPERELSLSERLLASLGVSLAITVCVSVLLAASPIGLSKGTAGAILGFGTAALALWAWTRTRLVREERQRPDDYGRPRRS